MITYRDILGAARIHGLGVVGAFHPDPRDGAPAGTGTILLLGPDGPDLWQIFSGSTEHRDGRPHGLDRWSERVIKDLAIATGGHALFPFQGPPWPPFQVWASRGEGAVQSPVGMQATPSRGLWTSYRGALAFQATIDLPTTLEPSPCAPCAAPCKAACPVDAFATGIYDTEKCADHVRTADGVACRSGCLVRKACPAGAAFELPADQRAFHMAAFLASHP